MEFHYNHGKIDIIMDHVVDHVSTNELYQQLIQLGEFMYDQCRESEMDEHYYTSRINDNNPCGIHRGLRNSTTTLYDYSCLEIYICNACNKDVTSGWEQAYEDDKEYLYCYFSAIRKLDMCTDVTDIISRHIINSNYLPRIKLIF